MHRGRGNFEGRGRGSSQNGQQDRFATNHNNFATGGWRPLAVSGTAHEASNRLFLTRLVHGRHRPILDLLPSLLYRGRQLVHVLQEKRKRPDLPVAEGVPERRHARQTNTVLDLPERNTFRVVLNPIGRQLRWLLIKAFRYR